MGTFATYLLIVLILSVAAIVLFAFFYERSSRQVSLVRTGVGGRKVAMDGGVLRVPGLHDVTRVNMQTLKLEVHRSGEQALITRDRLRVDVGAEFYLSVAPIEDAVDRASRTLGERTFDAERLRELIEGKLIDTLRSVAARMTMDELHEQRAEFVSDVRAQIEESLGRNGLALDSVSLTALDQTPFAALDENNAFNAVGMRKLAEVIATSKKDRARIDRDAEVSVHRSTMEASRLKLEIDLEEQTAELHQRQRFETLRAAQLSEIARQKADGERAASEARIRMEEAIRTEDISSARATREAEIASQAAIEIAEQERAIEIAERSKNESRARAEADEVRAESVKAAEALTTARALAEAERRRAIARVRALESGEVAHEQRLSAARTEAAAAEEDAHALLTRSNAEAEAARVASASLEVELQARAAGQRAINEADNTLDAGQIELRRDLARLAALPAIVEQMVKPAEKIESIRINAVSGLGGERGGGGGGKPPVNQAVDAMLDMAVQLPAMRTLGRQVGIALDEGVEGIAKAADDPSAAD